MVSPFFYDSAVFDSSDFKAFQAHWKTLHTDDANAERSRLTKGGFTHDERTYGKQLHGSITSSSDSSWRSAPHGSSARNNNLWFRDLRQCSQAVSSLQDCCADWTECLSRFNRYFLFACRGLSHPLPNPEVPTFHTLVIVHGQQFQLLAVCLLRDS